MVGGENVRKSIFFTCVFLAVILALMFIISQRDGKIAKIYCDGELIEAIDLSKAEESYTVDINGHNKALVENGKISMCYADCPDKLCIKMGSIADGSRDIVCLPNKIIIKIEDKAQ